jgi:signal transduction histidine kinase
MAETDVRIARRTAPEVLSVEVENRVAADAVIRDLGGTGRGLRGIEERVRMAGGAFSAGPGDGSARRDFLLRVELPLTDDAA